MLLTVKMPIMAQQKRIWLVSMRTQVRSLASLKGLRIHELQCRAQRQLRSRLAVAVYRPAAVAPIRPLAWELPYTIGEALKRGKKKNTVIDILVC